MNVLSCAHTHTTYCDGKTPAADMALHAFELGFVSLGFSSHAPQIFDPCYCIPPEREDDYKAEIRAISRQYAGRMAVYLGMERDAFSCASPDGYDYFLSAVHYLPHPDGHHTAVDGRPEDLRRYTDLYCGGDGLMMAAQYFSLLRGDVLAMKPQIIAHFDLVRKNNAVLRLYDEDSPPYRRLALDALRPLRDTGALLEVNTGAMARGYLKTPYPAPFLLKEWLSWGGEVIINSDCHDMRYLDYGFSDAQALLLSLGYDHAVRLGKQEKWERYSLA
ncbi:MAG: histidinol phosphate phosphatase [Clostridia bacterium]|nr:histidinol phosphate phosphatase [Clostridia bacterium]MBR4359967.1 histidinol phosphate phosphatase [Clostridia bacterium]